MTNKQLWENIESSFESLSLSLDQSKVNTILRLELYPKEKYTFDRQVFMDSINPYHGHFETQEWNYLVDIASGDQITLDEIYQVITIFKNVRETIQFLGQ